MRKTTVTCDRCGKEINSYDIKISSARLDLWGPGVSRTYGAQRIDLCLGCHEEFVNFLERGERREE